jgi:hypothetical protein
LVKSLSDDGETQLSIISYALVVACKSCKVSKEESLHVLDQMFDLELSIVPFEQLEKREN